MGSGRPARGTHIIPRLAGARFGAAQAKDNGLLTANWRMGDGAKLQLLANLSAGEIVHAQEMQGIAIWGDEANDRLPPWSVFWRLEAR